MSGNLQNLLRDALLNNTYDYTVLHKTLRDTWTNSYSYLYQLQRSLIGYEEHNYLSNNEVSREVSNIGHLYVNKTLDACFDINYDFIHVCDREEFKNSKFFENKFVFTDMVDNPQIFSKLPIIMIDGKAIWDYNLYAHNGIFTVILPYKRNFVVDNQPSNRSTNSFMYREHTIQVLVVDNILYERQTRLNRNILKNNKIEIKPNKSTNNEGTYFLSIHIPNKYDDKYATGTALIPCKYNGSTISCQVSSLDADTINGYSGEKLAVSIIFVNRLKLHTFYTGNSFTTCTNGECNLFMLQRDECVPYAMPIPVENLMIIRKRNDVLTYVPNKSTVELYYPNIYRIKDSDRQDGDIYYIYYFYKYTETLKYTPLHDFYYNFLKIHYEGEKIEQIVDTLYRGVSTITDESGNELDLSNISKLTANCGSSTISIHPKYLIDCGTSTESLTPKYILDCGDRTLTVDEQFINAFIRILGYGFYNHKYGAIDFTKRYLLEDDNHDKHYVEYKDETLRDWINEDPSVLRDYVINQNKLYNPVYHLWTNTINLEERIRTSTAKDVGEKDGIDLPTECYVFAFRNDNTISGKLLNIRVFVDGLLAVGMIQKRHYFTDYLYIPSSLITADSYIEVEIFPSYEFNTTINFTSIDDEKEIDLLEPADSIYPTSEDIYYIAPNGHMYESLLNSKKISTPSTGGESLLRATSDQAITLIVDGIEYHQSDVYNKDLFQITAVYNSGEYDIATEDNDKPVKFTRLNRFKIKPLSDNTLNNDIIFCISKVPNGLEIKVNDQYQYVSLVGLNFNPDLEYIRVFKNGRLVSKNRYVFLDTYSFPRIAFLDKFKKGDMLYIDITPYRYKEVYYQEEINEGQNLIDLHGYIDKPFDIRYYDVYLNGRKLSLNNVFAISPWKISLVNLKSIYHLQIFEKERDYEYFGTEFNTNKYYYTLDDLFNTSFITDDEKSKLIDVIINSDKDNSLNIVPNTNIEEKINFGVGSDLFMQLFYSSELIPKSYLNPDKLQVSSEIVKMNFLSIQENFYTTPKDSSRNDQEYERRADYDQVYILDPDIFVEGTMIETDNEHNVYVVGHPEDVTEDILNKSVKDDMNNIAE